MAEAARSFGKAWDDATEAVNQNPQAGSELVEALKAIRARSAIRKAILLRHKIELRNDFDKASEELTKAYDSGDDAARVEANTRVANLSDKLTGIYNVSKQAGTETARGLSARRMMANEDFSLAQMEVDKRAATAGDR